MKGTTLLALSLVGLTAALASPPAPAQPSPLTPLTGSISRSSAVGDDLNLLLRANLQQAALVEAQMKRLGNDHAAQFTWLLMLQDYNFDASQIAAAVREMGGKPDLSHPTVDLNEWKDADLLKSTLDAEKDLLRAAEIVKPKTHGSARDAIARLQGDLHHHANLLRSLKKGLPITGA